MNYLFLFYLIIFQGKSDIVVHNAWIRPAPESFNTALYCTVINNSAETDTLYKITSEISNDIEMHETYMKDNLIGMRPVKNFVIASHDSVVFKPGSYHIMIMNIKENATENSTKEIKLFFKKSGEVQIKAIVRSQR